jgi:5-methylcytosine-specific restriction endonuclease McrA
VTKTCSRCKGEYPLSNFCKDRTRADGLFPQCKQCKREGKHNYYLTHKDDINLKSAAWHKANPEQSRAIKARYRNVHKEAISLRSKELRAQDPQRFRDHQLACYSRHRDKILERGRVYRASDPEKEKARYLKYAVKNRDAINEKSRQRYAKNPTAHAKRVKSWHVRHPEKRITYVHRRRARRLANGGSYTSEQWTALKTFYNHTCLACGKKEPSIKLSPDHVIPIVRNGSNDIDNIQPLCLRCNLSKNSKIIDYRKKVAA